MAPACKARGVWEVHTDRRPWSALAGGTSYRQTVRWHRNGRGHVLSTGRGVCPPPQYQPPHLLGSNPGFRIGTLRGPFQWELGYFYLVLIVLDTLLFVIFVWFCLVSYSRESVKARMYILQSALTYYCVPSRGNQSINLYLLLFEMIESVLENIFDLLQILKNVPKPSKSWSNFY